MRKSLVVVLLLFVTLASAGLAGFVLWERNGMMDRLVQSGLEQKRLELEIESLRNERDRARAHSQNAPGAAAVASAAMTDQKDLPAPKVASTPEKEAPASSGAKAGSALAEMMKNPAMKEMIKQQQLAMLDSQYASLYGRFKFDDAEKTEFKRLLGERLMLESELGIKMMGEGGSKEQRDALVNEFKASKKASDASIREFLNNDEDFGTFQRWEDTKAERMQLDMGRSLFTNSGEALSPQQEQQLVDTMYQVRTTVPPGGTTTDLSKPENFDPSKINDAEIERQLNHMDDNARAVYQAASQFLTPKQLESLLALQQQWRSMAAAGLHMSATMFQPQKGTK